MTSKDKLKKLGMTIVSLTAQVASIDDGTIGAESSDLVQKMGRLLEKLGRHLEQFGDRALDASEEDSDGKKEL